MALGTRRPGRPYFVAEISFSINKKTGLLQDFYDACSTLGYRDVMALSRALNVHPQSIERWKYQTRFPRWETAIDVIEWVQNGKPMRKVHQSEVTANMM